MFTTHRNFLKKVKKLEPGQSLKFKKVTAVRFFALLVVSSENWVSDGYHYSFQLFGPSASIVAGCRRWSSFTDAYRHYDPAWLTLWGHNHIEPEEHRRQALLILDQMRAFANRIGLRL